MCHNCDSCVTKYMYDRNNIINEFTIFNSWMVYFI